MGARGGDLNLKVLLNLKFQADVTVSSAQGETGNFSQCLGHELGDSAGLLDPLSRRRVHRGAEVRVEGWHGGL